MNYEALSAGTISKFDKLKRQLLINISNANKWGVRYIKRYSHTLRKHHNITYLYYV
jgi:hypothetical protein